MKTPIQAVIFASGDCTLPNSQIKHICDNAELTIAADGGGFHAMRAQIIPDIVVGDFDSLQPNDLKHFETAGSKIFRHESDKDETDFELALFHALSINPNTIIIIGGLGKRLDHTFGNIGIFAESRFRDISVQFIDKDQTAWVLHGPGKASGTGAKKEIISLIPLSASISGVTTTGLRWPLTEATLSLGRSRSLCNEILSSDWSVSIESGCLLIINLPIEATLHHRPNE